jgi:type 1 glutamine amidotransferase
MRFAVRLSTNPIVGGYIRWEKETLMNRNAFLAAVLALLVVPMSLLAAEPIAANPIKVLIITGDHGHAWKETTPYLRDLLKGAGMEVDVTETPAKDLNADNLAKYDALLLNYKDTKNGGPETKWSDANKKAFGDAVSGGKGLFVYHHASSAFVSGGDWDKEFEKITAGGWRKQGYHGARHEYDVTVNEVDHPITRGLAGTYHHSNDELYQNSVVPADATMLATAWSDKKKDPKNTDKHEPMVWVITHGKGRVCNNALGHDVAAMKGSPIFQILLIRGVEWVATGEAKSPAPVELQKSSPK